MNAWLEITRPDGTVERCPLAGDRITVGRSPEASISLPDARDLEPEHLMIAPRGGQGCWVAVAQGAGIAARVGGSWFQHGMVPWGTEVEVGDLRLRLTDRATEGEKAGPAPMVSTPILLIVLAVVPLLGWLLFSETSSGIDLTTASSPPPLFDPGAECPTGQGTARHNADQTRDIALAKKERYPFASQDGVEAVGLFERAEACYRAVGAEERASEMAREADELRRRIDESYRTHRLRLERALAQRRYNDAVVETRALLELLRHRDGDPYLSWLQRLERQLQLAQNTPST